MTDAAGWAAALLAVDPASLGGVVLRAGAGPARDAWLAGLRGLLPDGAPWRRLPTTIADERLLGGLDLAATLQAGRPIATMGVLAEADGGIVVLPMAERLPGGTAARLAAVLDQGAVTMERDGLARRTPVAIGMVVLDEGIADDERPPAALLDRCAFLIGLDVRATPPPAATQAEITAGRARLATVTVPPALLDALGETAETLGIRAVRPLLLALRATRAAAALAGRDTATEADAILAGRLVLAPRAITLPPNEPPSEEEAASPDPPAEPPPPDPGQGDADGEEQAGDLGEILLEAARAAIPPGLLAQLQAGAKPKLQSAGRAGAVAKSLRRGRPIGVRRGGPSAGARLNVVETLRAAAPWQRLRRQDNDGTVRVHIRLDDFRITCFERRTESTVIFVVDASGSAALNRLAEAKGAVELLLADCYVRRDQVALLAFRGVAASLLLPPTGSLVRAKRGLAGLVGGGGTPLASGIDQAALLADAVRRRGQTPFVVMLTDGRGNIARDGTPGRARAAEDARSAAQALRATGVAVLLIDTSPNPQPQAAALAAAMGGRYLPLPYADAAGLSRAVRAAEPPR